MTGNSEATAPILHARAMETNDTNELQAWFVGEHLVGDERGLQ